MVEVEVVGALDLVVAAMVGVLSVAVDKLLADLLGQGELDLLALGPSQGGDTLLHRLGGVLDLGLGNALLLNKDLAADAGEGDGLVDAGLDGLGVANANLDVTRGDNGDVVGGLLLDLLAVLVAVLLVTMTVAGLAHGHHLGVALLLEADLHSLGGGVLVLLVVAIAAHLIVDHLGALRADSAGDIIAVLSVNNALDGQLDIGALGVKSGRADLGNLDNILNAAVVLGLLIATIGRLGMVRSRLGVVGSWLMMVGRLRLVGGRLRMIGGRLRMVGCWLGVVRSRLRVVGSRLRVMGLGSIVVDRLRVAVDDGALAMLLGLAKAVGLAANAEAGEGASVGHSGRQRYEGKEGEEGLEEGIGKGVDFGGLGGIYDFTLKQIQF